MKTYVLWHQKVQSGCIVSKTIEVFLNSDSAHLKAILLNNSVEGIIEEYIIEEIEYNDSEFLTVERAGDELFLIDENRNVTDIDVTYIKDEFNTHHGVITELAYDSISIHGIALDKLPISEGLKEEIRNMAIESADELNTRR